MITRSKSPTINRVCAAVLTAATLGLVIAGSVAPAAAGASKSRITEMTQDVTLNKSKAANKAADQLDAYIRG